MWPNVGKNTGAVNWLTLSLQRGRYERGGDAPADRRRLRPVAVDEHDHAQTIVQEARDESGSALEGAVVRNRAMAGQIDNAPTEAITRIGSVRKFTRRPHLRQGGLRQQFLGA